MIICVSPLPRTASRWGNLPLELLLLTEAACLPQHGFMHELTQVHGVATAHAANPQTKIHSVLGINISQLGP